MASSNDSRRRAKTLLVGSNEQADGLSDYEIAQMWGLSRSRVFQIRLRAMEKIRNGILGDPVLRELAGEFCGHELEAE